MGRKEERLKKQMEKNPVVKCNKIQGCFVQSYSKSLKVWIKLILCETQEIGQI